MLERHILVGCADVSRRERKPRQKGIGNAGAWYAGEGRPY